MSDAAMINAGSAPPSGSDGGCNNALFCVFQDCILVVQEAFIAGLGGFQDLESFESCQKTHFPVKGVFACKQ